MSISALKPETDLKELDRRIIVATQSGLPIDPQPYDRIAEQLGVDSAQVRVRINAMLADGRIRRIGVVANHYRLGYTANGMSVWDIPDEAADEAGERVGALETVSHCYLRPRALPDWPYNLFAMVHGHSRSEVIEQVEQIAGMLGDLVREHEILFSTRILKKTGLRIT